MKRRHLLATPAAGGDSERQLTLVVRAWCSLCDTMRDALAPVAARLGWQVAEVDLDAHPEWEARYGERVPVLLCGAPPDGEVLAEGRVDAALVEARLAGGREFR